MAEIQRHIARRKKRNLLSRFLHAKDDEKLIAAWKLDIDRIRRVFDVGSFTSARLSLTFCLQSKPATSTDVSVSQLSHDFSNPHTIVSNPSRDTSDAGVITPEVDRDVSGIPPNATSPSSFISEDTDNQNRPVSIPRALLVTRRSLITAQAYARLAIRLAVDQVSHALLCTQRARGIATSAAKNCS